MRKPVAAIPATEDDPFYIVCDDGTVWFADEDVNPKWRDSPLRRKMYSQLTEEEKELLRSTPRTINNRWEQVPHGPIPGTLAFEDSLHE